MEKDNKKYPRPVLIIICIVILAIVASYIYLLIKENPVRYVSRLLNVEIPKGSVVIIDKYDAASIGYSWTVIQIPSEKINEFTNSLKESFDWKPLPLPTELAQNDWCLQPPRLADGKIPISNAIGYYVLFDAQEAYNKKNNTHTYATEIPLCKRFSQNFLFGLFNEKDGRLYVWQIDY